MSHHTIVRKARMAVAVSALSVALASCASANPERGTVDEANGLSTATDESAAPAGTSTPTPSDPVPTKPAEPSSATVTPAGYEVLTEDTFVPVTLAALETSPTAHMTVNMRTGGQLVAAEGDVRYDGPSPAMAMTIEAPGLGEGRLEMRVVDGLVYLSLPPVTPRGSFVEIDPDDPYDPYAASFAGLSEQMDPRAAYKMFENGLRRVAYRGEDEGLHHYRLVLDTVAVARMQGIPQAGGMRKRLPYDVWLDDKNRMTRGVLRMGTLASVESRFSDWGEPVRISAPPARRIVERPGS